MCVPGLSKGLLPAICLNKLLLELLRPTPLTLYTARLTQCQHCCSGPMTDNKYGVYMGQQILSTIHVCIYSTCISLALEPRPTLHYQLCVGERVEVGEGLGSDIT